MKDTLICLLARIRSIKDGLCEYNAVVAAVSRYCRCKFLKVWYAGCCLRPRKCMNNNGYNAEKKPKHFVLSNTIIMLSASFVVFVKLSKHPTNKCCKKITKFLSDNNSEAMEESKSHTHTRTHARTHARTHTHTHTHTHTYTHINEKVLTILLISEHQPTYPENLLSKFGFFIRAWTLTSVEHILARQWIIISLRKWMCLLKYHMTVQKPIFDFFCFCCWTEGKSEATC